MRKIDLTNKIIIEDELLLYGFQKDENKYIFEQKLNEPNFKMVIIYEANELKSAVFDTDIEDEYPLVDVASAVGEFVGRIRTEYEGIISDVLLKCTKPNIFKFPQTKEILNYIDTKYKTTIEHLWDKFPQDAISRRNDSKKWYILFMEINESKLDSKFDRLVEVIDLRGTQQFVETITDNVNYFPGFHMNKKNWYTIILDGRVDTKRIKYLIDESFILAK